MFSMDTAPRDRKLTVVAQQMIIGLGPVDEPPFHAVARYYPEHDFWAAEDRELNGEIRLRPLHTLGWIC